MKKVAAEQIDQLLPQTQCGLCEYTGCMPYAKAISEGEAQINKCLPGGVRVLKQLGELLDVEAKVYIDDMLQKQKVPSVAVIDESLCIGCVKCIKACPVDVIIGTGKMMHTVIQQDCTGCELCIEPCPMDCISMVEVAGPQTEQEWQVFAETAREHYYQKQARVKLEKAKEEQSYQQKAKQDYIKAALARVQKK